jgi:hypothetical protein
MLTEIELYIFFGCDNSDRMRKLAEVSAPKGKIWIGTIEGKVSRTIVVYLWFKRLQKVSLCIKMDLFNKGNLYGNRIKVIG